MKLLGYVIIKCFVMFNCKFDGKILLKYNFVFCRIIVIYLCIFLVVIFIWRRDLLIFVVDFEFGVIVGDLFEKKKIYIYYYEKWYYFYKKNE